MRDGMWHVKNDEGFCVIGERYCKLIRAGRRRFLEVGWIGFSPVSNKNASLEV
jgi:hypothetical protein